MVNRSFLLTIPIAALLAGCATSSLEPGIGGTVPATEQAAARQLLEASVAAHGGDAYTLLDDVAVSYDGEWGRIVRRLQPVLTDAGYRRTSEERLLLDDDLMHQIHRGPDGEKTVVRGPGEVAVEYRPDEPAERGAATDEERAAAALVADAYAMFLLGPSYFLRHGDAFRPLDPGREDGRTYDRLEVRLAPGLGFSDGDQAVLWIDRGSRLLFRVQFSLEGLESTRGAEVDTTFHDHRRIDGLLWPSRFVERVRAPVRVFAHRWWVTGLDTNRGLAPSDLDVAAPSDLALRPAAPLDPPPVSGPGDPPPGS